MSPLASGAVGLVTIEENQDGFMVGLFEDEAGLEGGCLILQSGLTPPDEQDTSLGLDSYCLLDEEDTVYYGGVTRASLEGDTLTLSLSAEAARALGVDRTMTLTVPSGDVPRLAEALHRVFTYGNPDKQPNLEGI